MNAETLHAVDALYLENFLQTLLYKTLDADGELCEFLKQAETLSNTTYLSEDCRSRYAKIAKRLEPVVAALEGIAGDLYTGGELASDCDPRVQWGLVENIPEYESRAVIERLETKERELIATLNHIGKSLSSMPEAHVLWNPRARVRPYLKLRPIPERPCYQDDSMVRFCASPPYLAASYFAEPPTEIGEDGSRCPWLLDAEFSPLTNLPLFEDIEIKLEIRGDVTTDRKNGIGEHVYVIEQC